MDRTADVPVLVVGAGPTGLLLAAELHRRGVGCRLVDALPEMLHWDRATVVHPRSLEVFESLGLLEAFLAAGAPQRAARLFSDGVALGAIDLTTCGSRHGFNLGVSEQVTESILAAHLERQGGAVVRGARLVAVEDGPDVATAVIERDGVRETVSAGWIVGCDGLHSVTREATGIGLAGHDIAEPWAVFDATAVGWPEPYDANYVYLDELPVILTALPERRWRVYLRPSAPGSDVVSDALTTIRRYHPELRFDDVADPRRFHCHTKVATRFRSGRILLAGDAAHVCSPSQGHGMNSGVQDAYNLAWKLALVCAEHAGPGLLDSYEAERRPVAERILRSGDETELAMTVIDPEERRARDATMRAVLASAETQHQEAVAEAELDTDYAGSPIVTGAVDVGLRPGQRLPDTIAVQLPTGDGALLHELTARTGHTAVLMGGPAGDGELAALARTIRAATDPAFVEHTLVLATGPALEDGWARLDAAAAAGLGIGGPLLVIVRPDGHIGLVAGDDHARALAGYQALLAAADRPSGHRRPWSLP